MGDMNFIEWYNWEYVNDDDINMKLNTFGEIIKENYELCYKDYSEAYYNLADVFEKYLEYKRNV